MSEYTDQIQELRADIKFLQICSQPKKLIEHYFNELPKHNTKIECFNAINDRYFDLMGVYKYSDYNSFQRAVHYHKAKNHKI